MRSGTPPVRQIPALARHHYPWLIAAASWAAETITILACRIPVPVHELLGDATVCITIWALIRHYLGGRRLHPGEHAFTEADLAELERLYMAGLTARDGDRRPYRTVRGASG